MTAVQWGISIETIANTLVDGAPPEPATWERVGRILTGTIEVTI
jgi:hypothetical protein